MFPSPTPTLQPRFELPGIWPRWEWYRLRLAARLLPVVWVGPRPAVALWEHWAGSQRAPAGRCHIACRGLNPVMYLSGFARTYSVLCPPAHQSLSPPWYRWRHQHPSLPGHRRHHHYPSLPGYRRHHRHPSPPRYRRRHRHPSPPRYRRRHRRPSLPGYRQHHRGPSRLKCQRRHRRPCHRVHRRHHRGPCPHSPLVQLLPVMVLMGSSRHSPGTGLCPAGYRGYCLQ